MLQRRPPPFQQKSRCFSRPFLENLHWVALDVFLVPNGWHPSLPALYPTWPLDFLDFLLLPCQQNEKKVIAMSSPYLLKHLPLLKLCKAVTLALERAVQQLYRVAATLSSAATLLKVMAMEVMPMEVMTVLPWRLPAEAKTCQGAPSLAEM